MYVFHERITNDIQFNSSQADLVNFFWRSKFVVTRFCLRKKSNAFVRSGNNWYSLAQRAQERRPLRAKNDGIITLYRQRVRVYDCSQWVLHDMIVDVNKEWHICQEV